MENSCSGLGNTFGASWLCANAIDAAKVQSSTALTSQLVFMIRFSSGRAGKRHCFVERLSNMPPNHFRQSSRTASVCSPRRRNRPRTSQPAYRRSQAPGLPAACRHHAYRSRAPSYADVPPPHPDSAPVRNTRPCLQQRAPLVARAARERLRRSPARAKPASRAGHRLCQRRDRRRGRAFREVSR